MRYVAIGLMALAVGMFSFGCAKQETGKKPAPPKEGPTVTQPEKPEKPETPPPTEPEPKAPTEKPAPETPEEK